MEKIEFNNGTLPGINDINLNKLQDNVEIAIQEIETSLENKIAANLNYKHIKVTTSAPQTIRSDTVTNLNRILEDTTDGAIALSDNALVIGDNVNKIEISGIMFAESVSGNAGNYIWHRIHKNGDAIIGSILPATNSYISGTLPPIPVDVVKGDKFTMIADNTGSSGILRSGGSVTFLMIKIIQ